MNAQLAAAIEAVEKVSRDGANKVSMEVRDGRGMKIGQGGRQGDIYIFRVPEDWPRGERIEGNRLVEGFTRGARHTAEGDVTLYKGVKLPPYVSFQNERGEVVELAPGPLVVARKEWRGLHVEHPHYVMDPGTYQVVNQMDARSLSRVQD